jgi:uncharacterized protein YbjT (DUF2867 family)
MEGRGVGGAVKVVLFGASGMVGQGVLRECLLDPGVERVLSLGRTPIRNTDPKFQELVLPDPTELAPVEGQLRGFDACFFCLGTSVVGKSEEEYRRVTYELTLRVGETLARLNPGLTFVYVSGAGTDSTEHGPRMWARVKGATENGLLRLPFKAAYMFRPGAIQPLHGIRSRTPLYRVIYIVLWPLLPLLRRLAPNQVTTTERMGRAMLKVVRLAPSSPIVENREINHLGA